MMMEIENNAKRCRAEAASSYKVKKLRRARGTIAVPGDKSISHRAVMLGALADGTTHIKGFLNGKPVNVVN